MGKQIVEKIPNPSEIVRTVANKIINEKLIRRTLEPLKKYGDRNFRR